MSVGLLFVAFCFCFGILLWWWPTAIFIAFSNEDVTPDARAFSVAAIFFGVFFLALIVDGVGTGFAPVGTVLTVGVLLLLKPVAILGTDPEGPLAPKIAGVVGVLAGGVMAASTLL